MFKHFLSVATLNERNYLTVDGYATVVYTNTLVLFDCPVTSLYHSLIITRRHTFLALILNKPFLSFLLPNAGQYLFFGSIFSQRGLLE